MSYNNDFIVYHANVHLETVSVKMKKMIGLIPRFHQVESNQSLAPSIGEKYPYYKFGIRKISTSLKIN